MLSDYDRANIDGILSGAVGDWFTAHLLRYIGGLAASERRCWRVEFGEECDAVGERWTAIGQTPTLDYLMAKADSCNRARLDRAVQIVHVAGH